MKLPKRLPLIVLIAAAVLILLVGLTYWFSQRGLKPETDPELEKSVELLYGIDIEPYETLEDVVASGETLGKILGRHGITAAQIDAIDKLAEPVFPVRNIRAGHPYTLFMTQDTLPKLEHFVYEATVTEYLVISMIGDSLSVYKSEKEVRVERVMKTATINSSLWNCMIENDMSPALAMELSDIYAWSIDFFGLQKEDKFTVIYDQRYVDTVNVGVGTIWGAWFEHAGKVYYAIPFVQDEKMSYWDENGNSLRKTLLKAPLSFSRISSRFTGSRLHPVLKIRRPHYGVDYAAPSGTPVVAIADGMVIAKGYAGGGGNTVKIKHNMGSLVSGYLHLKGYGKGISKGARVKQGQVIGYVGSTGLSTGPHLDFRLWRGGTPIDPLKVPNEPAEPIRSVNKTAFEEIKNRVLLELRGDLPDSLKVTSFTL